MTIEGGTTTDTITFYYRDGLECFRYLFGNPLFKNYFDIQPELLYEDETMSSRLYYGFMNGDMTWKLQVREVVVSYVKLS